MSTQDQWTPQVCQLGDGRWRWRVLLRPYGGTVTEGVATGIEETRMLAALSARKYVDANRTVTDWEPA